jgi:hypothetical protein
MNAAADEARNGKLIFIGLVVAAAVFLSVGNVAANDAASEAPAKPLLSVEGGGADCGLWAKARKEPAPAAAALQADVIGFLNGLTFGTNREFWGYGLHQTTGVPGQRARGSITRDSVYLWLDNYCNANPLSGVYLGAITLFKEHSEPGQLLFFE